MTSRRALGVTIFGVLVAGISSAAGDLNDFARCVTKAGATYYGASWCPHCAAQNNLFGSAFRWIRYVDCTKGCRGVHSFPTWEFADGSRYPGVASLSVLASRTGCPLDGRSQGTTARTGRRDAPSTWSGIPTRQRDAGGARIIEVH